MYKFLPVLSVFVLFSTFVNAGSTPYIHTGNTTDESFTLYFSEPITPVVEIFPNPVTEGRLTINSDEAILLVQIMNITGKIVFSQEYQPDTSSVTIELNDVEKGVYLVRITFNDKVVHTEKIMVK